MGRTVFQHRWVNIYPWVIKAESKFDAYCTVCKRSIALGKMGESALKSHERSDKHRAHASSADNTCQQAFKQFHSRSAKSENESDVRDMFIPPPANAAGPSEHKVPPKTLNEFVYKNDVVRAEILWTLQTIVSHNSYKSNENINQLFCSMFPDSAVAKNFQCGEKKTAYYTVYGIAEYIRTLILDEVQGHFVILFDESLNKKLQAKQMDIHVRYWKEDKVVTRYLGSVFLGHGSATDMMEHFNKGITDLLPKVDKLVQISMDGPNVNWKFFELINKQIKKDHNFSLINIGSCGLHIVHNAFKTGAMSAGWGLHNLLSSLYYLFKDSPARREDFATVNDSTTKLPLKFVSHRWMENIPVVERTLDIWNSVCNYAKKANSKDKVITKPSNKSFEVVSSKSTDPLILAKLEFFKYIAMYLQPFLKDYQTDKPMTPFLLSDLGTIIRTLMLKVIKREIVEAARGSKLFSIDLEDKTQYVNYKKVDLGFSTEKKVREAKVNEKMNMEFRMECRDFILKLLQKLLEKSPVTYSFVRNLSALDPREMVSDPDKCKGKMKHVLAYLVSCHRLQESECDSVLREFEDFLDRIPVIGSGVFSGFDIESQRLDEFLTQYIGNGKPCLLAVVRICLVLSHGQASVERGFSINKKVECENLKEESVVAQRLICDYVRSLGGGPLSVPITKDLLTSVLQSRRKYESYLQKEKERKTTEEANRKRKLVDEKKDELKSQCKQARLDIEALNKSADDYSLKAEKERNFSHIAKANSLRDKAKEKVSLVKNLEEQLSQMR